MTFRGDRDALLIFHSAGSSSLLVPDPLLASLLFILVLFNVIALPITFESSLFLWIFLDDGYLFCPPMITPFFAFIFAFAVIVHRVTLSYFFFAYLGIKVTHGDVLDGAWLCAWPCLLSSLFYCITSSRPIAQPPFLFLLRSTPLHSSPLPHKAASSP